MFFSVPTGPLTGFVQSSALVHGFAVIFVRSSAPLVHGFAMIFFGPRPRWSMDLS